MTVAVMPNSTVYELLLFLHILTAIVGFGSTFVWPMLSVMARKSGDMQLAAKIGLMSEEAGRRFEPFILANGVLGLVLVAVVDSAYIEFSDTWVTVAMTLYIVALVVSFAFHQPNLKAMAALQRELTEGVPGGQGGPPPQVAELEERGKKAAMFGGILHTLFALILLDMVFKPGWG
jgi:uncharacterized membrane protein